jgi:hypothetical protein
MLTESDLRQLKTKGISVEQIEEQLAYFEKGFPCLPVQASASVE